MSQIGLLARVLTRNEHISKKGHDSFITVAPQLVTKMNSVALYSQHFWFAANESAELRNLEEVI